jgi:hypothetical protein
MYGSILDPDCFAKIFNVVSSNCDTDLKLEKAEALRELELLRLSELSSFPDGLPETSDNMTNRSCPDDTNRITVFHVTQVLLFITKIFHLYDSVSKVRGFTPQEKDLKSELEKLLMKCNEIMVQLKKKSGVRGMGR